MTATHPGRMLTEISPDGPTTPRTVAASLANACPDCGASGPFEVSACIQLAFVNDCFAARCRACRHVWFFDDE